MIEQLPEPVKLPPSKFWNPTQMNVATNNDRYDYDVQLTRECFAEKSSVFKFDRHGSIKLSRDGTPLLEDAVRKKGRPKIEWLREHNLGPSSHPVQWIDAMLSRKEQSHERKRNK